MQSPWTGSECAGSAPDTRSAIHMTFRRAAARSPATVAKVAWREARSALTFVATAATAREPAADCAATVADCVLMAALVADWSDCWSIIYSI